MFFMYSCRKDPNRVTVMTQGRNYFVKLSPNRCRDPVFSASVVSRVSCTAYAGSAHARSQH